MIYKAFATVLVGALFAAGCSSGSQSGAATNEDGTQAAEEGGPTAAQSDNAESGFEETVSGNSEIDDRSAIPVQRVEAEGNTLAVFFEMGSQKCYGVNAEAEESDSQVKVSLWTGELADAAAGGCGVGVYTYQTSIALDSPVGDRTLVAGDEGGPAVDTDPDDAVREIDVDDDGNPAPSQFVGLEIEVAIDLAEGNGLKWNVTELDGENRNGGAEGLGFDVKDDIVVAATWS